MAEKLLVSIIKFYRRQLSCYKPPSCRFYPTCSQYAIEAIERNGVVKGSLGGFLRILRCHPFSKGGYDPPL